MNEIWRWGHKREMVQWCNDAMEEWDEWWRWQHGGDREIDYGCANWKVKEAGSMGSGSRWLEVKGYGRRKWKRERERDMEGEEKRSQVMASNGNAAAALLATVTGSWWCY